MTDTLFKVGITIALSVVLFAILPLSPFQSAIDFLGDTPYMGYLNWFFPVGSCITLLVAWCAAIGTFYGVQWILRQFNIIS